MDTMKSYIIRRNGTILGYVNAISRYEMVKKLSSVGMHSFRLDRFGLYFGSMYLNVEESVKPLGRDLSIIELDRTEEFHNVIN